MTLKRMLTLAVLLVLTSASAQDHIWVEGEDAAVRKNKPHPWWYDKVKKDALSGNAWISHFNKDVEGMVGYAINVPKGGTYTFWLRANPLKTRLSYQLDTGQWTLVNFGGDVRGRMNIAADNKPDLRFIAWVKAGKLKLTKGKHTLNFKFHSQAQNHGAIDCFCLTLKPWVPSGAMKPGEAGGGAVTKTPVGPDKAIWIEGEDAARRTTTSHNWYNSVKKDALSGNQWAGHFDKGKAGTLTYSFDVVKADTYTFWLRGNPLRSKVTWTIDNGTSKTIDWKGARGRMNIAGNNKPDMRFIAWVQAGKVRLAAGKHSLKITLARGDEKIPNHGAVDCMAFVRIPWVPSGRERPSVTTKGALKPDTWFPVLGMEDEFSTESVIDMSNLVEAPAGKYGFLTRKGEDLQFEKATRPVKFWGIGSNLGRRSAAAMEQSARWYRKMGINLVRQHTVVGATGLLAADGKLDASRMDRYDRWFATLKKHGIYSTWSVVYPHHGVILQRHDKLDPARKAELTKGQKGNAYKVGDMINLDRDLQDIVLAIFKELLNHRNPHTGLAYKDDPALIVVEFQNESNLFFHTINNLRAGKMPVYAKFTRRKFFEFIKKKYGSKAKVATAWGNKWDKNDNWDAGELGLMGAYHWGQDGPKYEYKGQLRRCGDFIEFLADCQRRYYERRYRELRAIGFKGILVTTAWKGVGAASLANLYCDNVGDQIDRHNYFGGGAGGHRITEGKVKNATHLSQPGRGLLNLGLSQVANKPFAVSEWSMMPPAPWKAEAAPLYAFYGMGLQGWDCSYHFCSSASRLGDGWPGLGKYVSHTPHYIGQFPALAFAIYNNHIEEGDVVAARRVGTKDLFAGKDVLRQSIAQGGHDTKELAANVVTPPEALAAGKVTIAFDGGRSRMTDLGKYWDKQAKTITSTTGQLQWNYGDRYVEVRTARTQAVVGFVGGRTVKLPAVTAAVRTPFVSLIFTPLDNLELARSKHILITAMARDKQKGAKFNADWSKLITVGGPPLLLEPVQATIKLAGAEPQSIRPLDVYGVPIAEKVKIKADGTFQIDGTYAACYYEIKR